MTREKEREQPILYERSSLSNIHMQLSLLLTSKYAMKSNGGEEDATHNHWAPSSLGGG